MFRSHPVGSCCCSSIPVNGSVCGESGFSHAVVNQKGSTIVFLFKAETLMKHVALVIVIFRLVWLYLKVQRLNAEMRIVGEHKSFFCFVFQDGIFNQS